MAILLESDALSNVDISSRIEIGSFTATKDQFVEAQLLLTGLNAAAAVITIDWTLSDGTTTHQGTAISRAKVNDSDTTFAMMLRSIPMQNTYVLKVFATSTNASDTSADGAVKFYDAQTVTLTVAPVVGTRSAGALTSSPITLEAFMYEEKTFAITIEDSAGAAVDLSAKTLRFVVSSAVVTPLKQFSIEDANITITGSGNEIANFTLPEVGMAAIVAGSYQWKLWDVTPDQVLAHGDFTVAISADNA